MGCKFFVSSASFPRTLLFGIDGVSLYRSVFRKIKRLGFDGVEILLTTHVLKNLQQVIDYAEEAGLLITFHDWWTNDISGRIFTRIGVFHPEGVTLAEVLPANFQHPVVVSTYRWENRDAVPYARIQPVSGMPFEEQMAIIREEKRPLVFDVMHWMHYKYGNPLRFTSVGKLFDAVWREFYDWCDLVEEIHIYNWKEASNRFSALRNQNVFPDEGHFLVLEFLLELENMRWADQGEGKFPRIICLEISPLYRLLHPVHGLRFSQTMQAQLSILKGK